MRSYDAVLFISFGGPEKPQDVMPFLEIVTRGRGIPPQRLEEVAHHYAAIGGASPLNAITARQAQALQARLALSDTPWPVYVGNRNWRPTIEDTLGRMAQDGVQRAVGFITAAHRCEASLERYVAAVEEARKKIGARAPAIDYVGPWFDHPLFIEAIVQRIRSALPPPPSEARAQTHWIFTAHSIPCAMAEASDYVSELRRTAQLVCQKLDKKEWSLAYSSRSGSARDPWLEPDVCDLIGATGAQGVRHILLIPIGFIADHVEVLFDLDVEAREAARKAGIEFGRAQTVGDHPVFIDMIAQKVRERAAGGEEPGQTHSTRAKIGPS